jgi:hypothetical protein
MVIDYYQKTDAGIDEVAQMLKEKGYSYGTHIWPHDAQTRDRAGITFEMQAHDFNISGYVLERHGLLDGINLVRTTLSKMWFDGKKCKDGLTALSNYKKEWNTRIGGFTSKPVHDAASHGCFPFGTLIHTINGELDISLIKKGDLVLTPNGYKKVLKTFVYNANKLQSIHTTTRAVRCTHNHKIYTRKGLVHSDAMRYNDEIFSIGDMDICLKIGYLGRESGLGFRDYFLLMRMENPSILMEGVTSGMEATIGRVTRKNLHFQPFKDPFGHIIMEKFQRAIKYIIKILMPGTMMSQTCNASRLPNIPNCTNQKSEAREQGKASISQWNMRKSGMDPKRESSGIENMQRKQVLEKEIPSRKCVISVTKNTMPKHTTKDSVLTSVKQRVDTNQGSTTGQGIARFVDLNSFVINTSLKEHVVQNVTINLPTTQEVYDIEVEDDHCYFANGFLVSNSDAMRYLCAGYTKVSDDADPDSDFAAIRSYWGG